MLAEAKLNHTLNLVLSDIDVNSSMNVRDIFYKKQQKSTQIVVARYNDLEKCLFV